jgi:ABC-type Fe3+/spermidine/putrescine transport system ATPase subunit
MIILITNIYQMPRNKQLKYYIANVNSMENKFKQQKKKVFIMNKKLGKKNINVNKRTKKYEKI